MLYSGLLIRILPSCVSLIAMNKKLPSLKQRLHDLIRTASVSSVSPQWDMSNLSVIELLASWFEQLGFNIDIQTLANGKANMIATFGTGPGGLILSGHTDTVPFNESSWQYAPLALTENNQRFYGLGTADMKSFFALIIEAVIPLLNENFNEPLIILATADEESSMSGARALVHSSLPIARAAIIGEPTNLKPIHMHKSIMMNSIKITGQSGHSSNPALGKNALDAMHDVITALKTFRSELAKNHQHPAFEVAVPTLNLGCIHGGDNPNRICHSCELHFDFRGLPHMKNIDIKQQILEKIQPIATNHAIELQFEELFEGVEAFQQNQDTELVKVTEKLTGYGAEAVAFATEAPFLKQLGIDTIILGPGSIDQAHQPDEYIALNQITPTVELLRQLIGHYCLTTTV